ncbi:MAG: tetratricopeptide repeat protein [Salinarimonas sp.]|nr:tetratricopeptide repeat protein [Salinarimonas sp.]
MNEFFREVDEEFRRDKAMAFWKRWGGAFVVVAVIVVAGVGGWRYWDYLEAQRAHQASAQLFDAQQLIIDGNRDSGIAMLEELAAEGRGGFPLLARFRIAAALGEQSPARGAEAFDDLAADSSVPSSMRDLATLRAAMLRLDTDPAAAASALEQIATPDNGYRHSAREALGLAALRRGDYDTAGRWFDEMAADPETPSGLRGRLEIYSALVAAGPVETM